MADPSPPPLALSRYDAETDARSREVASRPPFDSVLRVVTHRRGNAPSADFPAPDQHLVAVRACHDGVDVLGRNRFLALHASEAAAAAADAPQSLPAPGVAAAGSMIAVLAGSDRVILSQPEGSFFQPLMMWCASFGEALGRHTLGGDFDMALRYFSLSPRSLRLTAYCCRCQRVFS